MQMTLASSFQMGIINNPIKSRDVAKTKCFVCGDISSRPLAEHKRNCKKQSKYVDKFHCRTCLRKSNKYRHKISESIKNKYNDPEFVDSQAKAYNQYLDSKNFYTELKSFQMGIINNPIKSRDVAKTKCFVCGDISSRPLAEHKRNCKKQSKYVDKFHCRTCLRKSNKYKSLRDGSRFKTKEWKRECSIRSIESFKPAKTHVAKSSIADQWKMNISKSMRRKFEDDEEYIAKIRSARERYWDNPGYKTGKISFKQFINISSKVHNNKYDYSKVHYKDSTTKITIICPEHGEFKQIPKNHYNGHGCLKCAVVNSVSAGELKLVDFIRSLDIKIETNNRSLIGPYELDIAVFEHKLAIEYNGLFWHSYDNLIFENKKYHLNKTEMCARIGYRLVHIFENEWLEKSDIIKSKLLYMFNRIQNRIYARKCKIIRLNNGQASIFFNESHIQGHRSAKIIYGLKYADTLVAVISFSRHQDSQWEIIRYAVKPYYSVVGGFSRLLKYFIKDINPDSIVTYADRRYSDGGLYSNNGFKLIKTTSPNYYYVSGNKLLSRQKFQKHKLKNRLEKFDASRTEAENMFMNGYRRIWDCGHYKFIHHLQ